MGVLYIVNPGSDVTICSFLLKCTLIVYYFDADLTATGTMINALLISIKYFSPQGFVFNLWKHYYIRFDAGTKHHPGEAY